MNNQAKLFKANEAKTGVDFLPLDCRAAPSKREIISGSHRRFVIINGDDFGFSRSVNRGIIEAHERGY